MTTTLTEDEMNEFRDEYFNTDGDLSEESRRTLEEHPTQRNELQAEWDHAHRFISRQDIIQKMNYRHSDDGCGFPADDFGRGFDIGLRNILGQALALPRTTTDDEYATHFNLEKRSTLFWYFRAQRSKSLRDRIEAQYPDETSHKFDTDEQWAIRSGEIATVRWLSESNRDAAEAVFPCLDS